MDGKNINTYDDLQQAHIFIVINNFMMTKSQNNSPLHFTSAAFLFMISSF